jgi:two-component system OmpR family sensor kinase
MLLIVTLVMFLYMGAVLVAFNDIRDLFVRKVEWQPRDIVVHAVRHSRIEGKKVAIDPASLKLVNRKKGWLQVVDEHGQEVYAYKKPTAFPTHYYPGELVDLKEYGDQQRGYHLYTWFKTVQGKSYTFILGQIDVEDELLYRVRVSTKRDRGKIRIPPALLDELDKKGMWLQILDEHGTVAYHHHAENQLRSYSPGVFVDYVKDHNVIYQEGSLDGQRWTWLSGIQPSMNGDQDVPTRYEATKAEQYRDHIYLLIFWGNILLVLAIAFLFGQQFGRPMLHMMSWIQELARGRFREPVNKKGLPKSVKPDGKMRRSYRLYREVMEALKDLTHTLKQNEDQRRRLEKTREDWIAGVSHDLRTPLSSVKGYADLMAEEQYQWEPAEIRRYAEVIRDKAGYMEQLIEDLNLTFRLKNDSLPLTLAEHDLVEVVRQTVIDLMNDQRSETVSFTFHAAMPHIRLQVDKQWFQRALKNLLVNAVLHNPPGTEVKVSVWTENGRVAIQVEDSGRGMDEETQAMLFERYYRGTNTAKRTHGTGLGMAIAKQLIEAHGGDIHIDSQVGRGTRILILVGSYD